MEPHHVYDIYMNGNHVAKTTETIVSNNIKKMTSCLYVCLMYKTKVYTNENGQFGDNFMQIRSWQKPYFFCLSLIRIHDLRITIVKLLC